MTAGVAGEAAEEFFTALGRADVEAGVRIATGLRAAGVPVAEILDGLVVPAQRRVGEYWAAGRWDVAREHAATHVCEQVVAALTRPGPAGPPEPRGRIVLACADGEWHALPARLAAERLRAAGWEAVFLGACTPARHLARFLESVGPDAVGLSCTFPAALPRARATIESARQLGVPVLAGGPGFGPDGRWALRLGATAWAVDGDRAATRLAAGWPAFADPAPAAPGLDDEQAAFARREAVLGAEVAEALLDGTRTTGPADLYQAEEVHDCGPYVTGFLSAALLVDDADLMTSQTRWLTDLLEARGVGRERLAAAYDGLDGRLGSFPRARRLLAAGRELLPA
ncbi:cobalamin B12-binding domain-containing protein [Actinomadura kijaniata]|uniref:cobalamin B12-binding domain-containing protein n=1 Tax=Actinomadura kijaniata TaxID=46161 RepID=UPI003F193516